jgi:hypothetical protein
MFFFSFLKTQNKERQKNSRVTFSKNMRTGTFLEEVACHRDVQARLHRLFPSQFNWNNSHEFRFILSVVHKMLGHLWRLVLVFQL